MNKKLTSTALAALMIAGTTSFTAFAAMGDGTVVIGTKAYSLTYANDPAHAAEITAEVVAGGAVYVKDFNGNWLNNLTNLAIDASTIPAVTYKSATGVVSNFDAGDKDAVTTVEVASVSASNLKEVVVTFNKAVTIDATKATSDYFAVKSNTVSAIALSADKMTATLTLGTNVAQQADVEVTTKKATGLIADVVKTLNVIDTTLPVAQSIKMTGPSTFDITFNEPLKTSPVIELENGIYSAVVTGTSADGKTVSASIGTTLAEGKYNVKVSGFQDYASFSGLAKTFEYNYIKDITAPVVTLSKATQTSVEVKFDKAVTGLSIANFYHTYSAWAPDSVTPSADNKTYTLNFASHLLQEGNVNVYVLKNDGTTDVKDAWGNKMAADAKLVATIVNDSTAPTVTKVEATAENNLAVTFSEDVTAPIAANFVIKDKDAKVVTQTITGVTYDATNKLYNLALSSKLAGGIYTVEIKDVTDLALSKNKITTITSSFTISDKTAIDLTAVTFNYVLDGSGNVQYIYANYPEAVMTSGSGSALSKDNYLVQGVALKTADKAELFDAKTVKITLATPVVLAATPEVTIGRVADLAGNVPTIMSSTNTLAPATAPTTFTAKMIGLNKVEIKFAGVKLTNITADAFTATDVDNVANTFAAATYTIDAAGNTIVTGTLKSTEALTDKTDALRTALSFKVVAAKIKTVTGQTLDATTTAVVPTDGIAPALFATTPIVQATGAAIDVKFDEDIITLSDDLAATDIVVVDKDGKTLVAGVNYTVDVATGNTLEITLVNTLYKGNVTVSTKPVVTYIQDAAGNVVTSVAAKTVEIK